MALESKFESEFVKQLVREYPGIVILKNDTRAQQGIPDRLALWRQHWGMFEFKRGEDEPYQPNQPYWVERFNDMSFGSFVYPENAEDVLYDLQQAWRPRRQSRIPQSKRLSLG